MMSRHYDAIQTTSRRDDCGVYSVVDFGFTIEFNTTRNSLEQQQRSEVNNTINTVGLALAPYLEKKDTIAVESVINALFDGSSYSIVRLIFLDDGTEILRSYPIQPNNVPAWFTQLNLFEPIHDRRVVTSGWMQLAEVEIVSHPGAAYAQLWKALIRLSIAFLAILVIGMFAVAFILKRSLRPLQLIVNKMEQVANNQFGEPLPRPNTRDLIYVVDGINKMSEQVEKAFKAQAKEAQQLRERAYLDPVSHLGNRAYYMSQLSGWLSESGIGGVAILQAEFIKELYEEKGYEAGDGMVRELADRLKTPSPSRTSLSLVSPLTSSVSSCLTWMKLSSKSWQRASSLVWTTLTLILLVWRKPIYRLAW